MSLVLLRDQLDALDAASQRLARYDDAIDASLADHDAQIDLLMAIPDINKTSSSSILLELGRGISVFTSRRHLTARTGLYTSNNERAGKRRSGRSRRGNATPREVLVECAQGALAPGTASSSGFNKALAVRRGYCKATAATAHKMIRVFDRVLRNGVFYLDSETDCEAAMVQRNAPRWIRMLKKHGIGQDSTHHMDFRHRATMRGAQTA